MKLEVKRNTQTKKNVEFPYFAQYDCGVIVLVTGVGKNKGRLAGYMASENACYQPFEYFADDWDAGVMRPLEKGAEIKITI